MRERESERESERKSERESVRKKVRKRERERVRKRGGRDVEYGCFIFNRNDGCLGTF